MTTLHKLQAEAARLYSPGCCDDSATCAEARDMRGLRGAHVRAKTISAEQVEALARGWSDAEIEAYGAGPYPWSQRDEQEKLYILEFARSAFEAAGFYVKEAGQ